MLSQYIENDYQKIKEKLDLLSIITQETGFKMKGHHLEECPFCHHHNCFSIKEKSYKCFSCPATGDVFTFFEKFHNLGKNEALKKAASLAGIKLKEHRSPDIKLTTKERIFIAASEYYHSHMHDNGGRQYLIDTRGHNEDVLDKMHVGWTDGGLVQNLRTSGFTDDEIKKSGLAKVRQHEGKPFLSDYFVKGMAIFPHFYKSRVLHFTIKDPEKKINYQLENTARLGDWRFYNQDALEKYNELIAVEGENDLLSVLDAGVGHVIGLIGQPSEEQIKALRTYCKSKHLYLWLDNDEDPEKPMTKGKGYIRKICGSLHDYNVRIIVYEGHKDPDEYLRKFEGDRKKEIRRLQTSSVDYITWEIREISNFETLELRLKALKERKVFSAVANMVEAEKLVYVEKLISLGFTRGSIEEQLDINQDLRHEISLYLETLGNKRDADPNIIALKIFKHFSQTGRFFYDRMNSVFLLLQRQTYEIGNNRPFNALVKKATGLLPTKEPGRSTWESLASEAYNAGTRIDLASWIFTDRNTDTIFINLNSANNIILKISKDSIEEIPNGLNKEGVLLKSSKKILPVNFLPDIDVRDGMKLLEELILQNLTCDKEERYLIISWFISAFLLDLSPYVALMKFSGPTSSGKTTAARLISLLIYGNDYLTDPSTAAAYAVASQSPLLIIDNLESEDITKSLFKFLMLTATRGGKEKRTQGTESETTEEKPKCLCLITAIEPFTKTEMINRAYDIEFHPGNKNDSFLEDEIIRSLAKNRDIILSAVIRFIQKDVLPFLSERKKFITILKTEYKNHAKNRTDEYLSILMLIVEKLLKYMPYYQAGDFLYGIESGDKEIRKAWIERQDARAKETETASSNIIKLLDGLVREYLEKMKNLNAEPMAWQGYDDDVYVFTHPEYFIEMIKTKPEIRQEEEDSEPYTITYVEFVAMSSDLVSAFDKYCRNYGIKNPYTSASIFSSRLKTEQHLLRKGGWELITRKGYEPYYTKIHGERFYKFRKTIVR